MVKKDLIFSMTDYNFLSHKIFPGFDFKKINSRRNFFHLYFCGRKGHRVQVENKTYFSIPTERIFNVHPKVRRSALVALKPRGEVAIVIEPQPQYWPSGSIERSAFTAELLALGEKSPITKDIKLFFFHRSFPVDARHNAKIFRDRLGTWASEQRKKFE